MKTADGSVRYRWENKSAGTLHRRYGRRYGAFLRQAQVCKSDAWLCSDEHASVLQMALWVDSLADWKVFGTFTFKAEVSKEEAQLRWEKFAADVLPWGVNYFYVIEPNPSRDGHHIHVIWDNARVRRDRVWSIWFHRFGVYDPELGFVGARNRIEPVRNHNDVVRYCTAAKYVLKGYSFWGYHLTPRTLHDRAAVSPPFAGGRQDAPQGGAARAGRIKTVPPERLAASDLDASGAVGQLISTDRSQFTGDGSVHTTETVDSGTSRVA